jgi:hypothetical protein
MPDWSAGSKNSCHASPPYFGEMHFQQMLDLVVINAGIRLNHDLTEDALREIRAATDEVGITAIYKTTTKNVYQTNSMLRPHDAFGCRILDYSQFIVDEQHGKEQLRRWYSLYSFGISMSSRWNCLLEETKLHLRLLGPQTVAGSPCPWIGQSPYFVIMAM